jgi:hypothetical protein
MVKLYTWLPGTPNGIFDHEVLPDLGHCSLEVIEPAGQPLIYASFWPNRDCLAGKLTDLLKHRQARQPRSYMQEIAPDEHFMQRPPDFVDTIAGLDEGRIVAAWLRVRNTKYHFRSWNCSSVCKYLLLNGMSNRDRRIIENTSPCTVGPPMLAHRCSGLLTRLRTMARVQVVACVPEDVRLIVEEYNSLLTRTRDASVILSDQEPAGA